jgi:tetratricopeptide (TPR) repeat protein
MRRSAAGPAGRARSRRATARSPRAAALLAALTVSCGGAARPPAEPSPAVRTELAQAEAAERARRHDAARVHYERAIAAARDPASEGLARREYGETLATWGEATAAIAQLQAAVRARPDAGAWHDLGLLHHQRGDLPAAVAALERARSLAPTDVRPRVALAAQRWKAGDRAGAAAEYRGLLELALPQRLREKVEWALRELARP